MMVFYAWYAWRSCVCWRGSMGAVIPNETLDLFGSRHRYSSDWLVVHMCCFWQGLSCCWYYFITINEEGLKLWAVLTGNTLWGCTLLLLVVIIALNKAEGFTWLCWFKYGYGCRRTLFWWHTVKKLRFEMTFCDDIFGIIFVDDIFGLLFFDDIVGMKFLMIFLEWYFYSSLSWSLNRSSFLVSKWILFRILLRFRITSKYDNDLGLGFDLDSWLLVCGFHERLGFNSNNFY